MAITNKEASSASRRGAKADSGIATNRSKSHKSKTVRKSSSAFQKNSITFLIASQRKVAGVPAESVLMQVRSAVKSGLPRAAFDLVRENLGTTIEKLSEIAGIPTRTLARREKFKPDESDRLYRIDSVFQRAVAVLENVESARSWMGSPQRALGGRKPLDCCDTLAGAQEVERLLGRVEYGVFS
ncbi:MAG TPA: antitoxin Xre/MbcA/ParS toxin-binding domain-containing protein [Spirochaetia bacterium]|nr:antitoxin Xre/MbcA/ParS toxin-binding domain-containing protein [Spirochaetia bacterium]